MWRFGQGYLLIGNGSTKYLQLALNCAASIKTFDTKRKIQLLTDLLPEQREGIDTSLFDYITFVPADDTFIGPAAKLLMDQASRFRETMFVDADCLLLRNPDEIWESLKSRDVAIPGNWRASGIWYGVRIEDMMSAFSAPRIAQINSGVCYFKRGARTAEFFATARRLLKDTTAVTFPHRSGPTDEPYLGAAFGIMDISPTPVAEAWMISTIRTEHHVISDHPIGYSFIKGGKRYSPAFPHFVSLEPEADYARLVSALTAEDGPLALRKLQRSERKRLSFRWDFLRNRVPAAATKLKAP